LRLHSMNQPMEAARCYFHALELQPDFFEAAYNLGTLLLELGQVQEAIACYRRALELQPNSGRAWGNLGIASRKAGQSGIAVECLRKALLFQPHAPDVLNNLGNALRAEQQYDEAILCLREAVVHAPAEAGFHLSLGHVLRDSGRVEEAMESINRALQLQPAFADAHWDLAYLFLLMGDFTRGFAEYEWRWRRADFRPRRFSRPLWQGQDLAGRAILVHAEQGAGDTIQFVRLVTRLAARGARVVLECSALLRPLLESMEGVDRIFCKGDVLPEFDYHVPLLSLPHRLELTQESIPADVPYLQVPNRRQCSLPAPRENHGPLKVGFVWRGSSRHENDRQRSIPLDLLVPLFMLPDVAPFSLQVSPSAELSIEVSRHPDLVDLSPLIGDFAETASLITQLDLVISVDTSVAHLAGALGRPVWTLLPFAPDWRWLLDRADSPWYPTMRLFRQPTPGDWVGVVQQVVTALRHFQH
jgi:Tetratricopeptide repeat/TPR repeat/Glycosyltransferase family 9 (heptosyltransferase)